MTKDPVYEIIERFHREGIGAVTADDSAEIKGFIREYGWLHPTSELLTNLFPVEAAEVYYEGCGDA